MGGFDSNGDDVVDMYIDETVQALGGLRAHVATFESARAAAFTDVDACSAKLGKGGDLSDRFMESYGPWRTEVTAAVADLKRMYDEVAANGDAQVAAYRTAEQESVDGFRA